MKKPNLLIVSAGVIFVITLLLTFIYYKSNNNLIIYTTNDSYAYTYAKKNMIKTYNVSDSHYNKFYRVWEDFKYNEDPNGLTIIKYEGISEDLIIPTSINNKKIIKVEKDALPSTVKKVFIPEFVESIEISDYQGVEISCYRGNYCEELKLNEKLNVLELSDVDRFIYNIGSEEFTYNIINDTEVEITNYLGNDENVIIPESINGYKVTAINFDGEGITSMFIPKTVNSISGNITSKLLNKCFITSVLIILSAFIINIIVLLKSKFNEFLDIVYIGSLSGIYWVVSCIFLFNIRNNPFSNFKYLIWFIIVSVIYLITSFILGLIIKNNKCFDETIKHKNDFIKTVISLLKQYNYEELDEIIEMIKYSDPVSTSDVVQIENNIIDIIKLLNDSNLKKEKLRIKQLIEKRNDILKNNK